MLDEFLQYLSSEDDRIDFILRFRKVICETYEEFSSLVEKELDKVAEALAKLYRPVNYPYEVIPVPTIKFTKRPLIKWESLQDKEPTDIEIIKLRRQSGKLGILINHLFILKGFVVIDLDINLPSIEEQGKKHVSYVEYSRKLNEKKREILSLTGNVWDVETRRGFQKFFYLPNAEAILVKYSRGEGREPVKVFWTSIDVPEHFCKIEIRTSRRFLNMFPEASHYLDIANNRLIARKYRALSVEAKQFAYSCSVELLKAKPDDIKEFLYNILSRLDEHIAKSICNNIQLELVDKQRYIEIIKSIGHEKIPEDKPNFSLSIGTLTYNELKKILKKIKNKLPNCVRIAFFENVPRGYCYAFARLVASFIFYIVKPVQDEVDRIAEDFANRFASFKSPKRRYWLYFSFGIKPKGEGIGFPTTYGIGREVFEMIRELADCEKCVYKNVCKYYNAFVLGKNEGLTVRQIMINLLRSVLTS